MKRVASLLMAVTLAFGLLVPSVSLAAIPSGELETFLTENEVTEDELSAHLDYYHYVTLEDFETADELSDFLGELINIENLTVLLTEYGFADEAELIAFLMEYDEIDENTTVADQFLFINALTETIDFYSGTPINDENLQQLLKDFELTLDELEELLSQNNDSLENYEFIEDLEFAVVEYLVPNMFGELGITDEEFANLTNHFLSLTDLDPLVMEQNMTEIMERMDALGDFESAEELTEEEIAELMDIMYDMLAVFELNAEFYLVKGGTKTALSDAELAKLQSTNGADMLIELYNLEGTFLADVILTADLFGSDLIEDITTQPVKVVDKVKNPKTVKGGKLPNTAGNYTEGALLGFGLLLAGAFMFRKRTAFKA
ncbi:processed acidic surface protein [Mesobacillus harenae]|uniref:processed acidic surface protein n=1 Tax=Mesobacillus harenae TaxID=2213203 RepID=UPI0015806BCA|nr:processed acidic surface protein [Mesobacillus harenae]